MHLDLTVLLPLNGTTADGGVNECGRREDWRAGARREEGGPGEVTRGRVVEGDMLSGGSVGPLELRIIRASILHFF